MLSEPQWKNDWKRDDNGDSKESKGYGDSYICNGKLYYGQQDDKGGRYV